MDVKDFGKSAAKFDALGSLARTDDMLAVIGIIMLMGVIVSAYGSFWQGRLASSQFKQQCAGPVPTTPSVEQNKTTKYTIAITVSVLLIIGLMVYIFRKQLQLKK